MLVNDLLRKGIKELEQAGIGEAEIDAQLLLGHCLCLSRTQLFLAARDTIKETTLEEFLNLLERRKKREPVAYLLGEREFWSLPFHVDNNVLIPRPETEFLLEKVLDSVQSSRLEQKKILDICCGSGVISVVLALELRGRVVATDISLPALAIAKKNSLRHRVHSKIDFVNCNLFSALSPEKQFSLIVSNPPYVTRDEISGLEPEVKDHEPHLALDGGEDGLDLIRIMRESLTLYLAPGGYFFMEFGEAQATTIYDLFVSESEYDSSCLFERIEILKDYSGRDRVLLAKRKI